MEQKNILEASDLLLFANIIESGNFSRAAAHLNMPKSSLSRRIRQLEEYFGERLLLRTTRKLTLTEFGRGLLAHAYQIKAEVEAATAFAQHRQARPSGRLRISMSSDFANMVLVELLAAFTAMHPGIFLDIDLSPRQVDLLEENFDLALRMGSVPDSANLAARRFGTFPSGLYAAPSYLAEYGMPDNPHNLTQHTALCLPGRAQGKPAPWMLHHADSGEKQEIAPSARLIANSPELLLRLAQAGGGIAGAPEIYTAHFIAQGKLVRILPQWGLTPINGWAIFPERRLMPAKTRAFLDMLANCSQHQGSYAAP